MEYKSIFITAYKILRRSRLAWLFSFAYSLNLSILTLYKLSLNLVMLLCCLEIAWLFLFIATSLGLSISLYYDFLEQPLTFMVIWNVIRSIIIRWATILTLFYFPSLLLYVFVLRLMAESNLIIAQLATGISFMFFFQFTPSYILLTILQYKLGFWEAIKQGIQVWSRRLDIKFGIAMIWTIINIIVQFLYLLSQNRSLI